MIDNLFNFLVSFNSNPFFLSLEEQNTLNIVDFFNSLTFKIVYHIFSGLISGYLAMKGKKNVIGHTFLGLVFAIPGTFITYFLTTPPASIGSPEKSVDRGESEYLELRTGHVNSLAIFNIVSYLVTISLLCLTLDYIFPTFVTLFQGMNLSLPYPTKLLVSIYFFSRNENTILFYYAIIFLLLIIPPYFYLKWVHSLFKIERLQNIIEKQLVFFPIFLVILFFVGMYYTISIGLPLSYLSEPLR
jgi:hypothetical protein